MWNSDEEKYRNRADKALNQYVREEYGIYEEDIYNELLSYYPTTEDLTVYRGINFASRLAYHRFMKKLNKNDGFITENKASSYTRDIGTAQDFSETTKTYFPTPEIVAAEEKRRLEGETLSGYCGVILKTTVKKGEAVDVNRSEYGIEDEILIEPQKAVKVEVEVVNSLKYQVNKDNFDINEYVQNCNDLSDPIFQYITINKSDRINNESANHIFDLCIPNNKSDTIAKRLELNKNEELILDGEYLTVIKNNTLKSWKDDTRVEKFQFFTPNLIATYETRGCLRPEQYKRLQRISNSILNDTMQVFYEQGQDITMEHLKGVSWFAKFALPDIKETYEKSVLMKQGRNYRNLENKMREVNNSGLSGEIKEKKIEEYTESIENIINSIMNEKVNNKTRKTKRLSGRPKL